MVFLLGLVFVIAIFWVTYRILKWMNESLRKLQIPSGIAPPASPPAQSDASPQSKPAKSPIAYILRGVASSAGSLLAGTLTYAITGEPALATVIGGAAGGVTLFACDFNINV